MHAFLAEHALTAAPLELFPRVIHSTTSTLMFVFHAVLAKLPALQALSLKADKRKSLNDLQLSRVLNEHPVFYYISH